MAKRKHKKIKSRNLLHDHPLLRKCDVHEKTYKAERRQEKIKLNKECFDQNALV